MTQSLIIIRGNSGSGKSTIAKKLQQAMGYKTMLIQQDIVRREMLRVKDTDGNPSIDMMRDMVLYGKRIGYDVIIEGIMVEARYGDMLRALITEFDNVHAYYLAVSFAETVRRHATKPNAHEFGEEEMRRWWVDDDRLGVEGEKVFTDGSGEQEIVSEIVKDLEV